VSAPPAVASCPLCDGTGAPAFNKNGYDHYACQVCQTWFIHPLPSPDALATFYRDAAEEQNSRICWQSSQRHLEPVWLDTLRAVQRVAGEGPILDVGCGTGQFLAFAETLGFAEAEGVELATGAAELARKATSAPVHEGDLWSAPLEAGRFAAVTFWDVIEHLPDPRAAMRRAWDLLRPDGMVALGTPHRHGVTLRSLGHRALVVMPPEHVFLPSRRGLELALAHAGFTIEHAQSRDVHLREWLRFVGGREGAASNVGAARADARRSYLRRYEILTGAGPFRAAQAAANALLRVLRLGDQLVVLARKREARR
jgi:SAM-dependent methyltransferase